MKRTSHPLTQRVRELLRDHQDVARRFKRAADLDEGIEILMSGNLGLTREQIVEALEHAQAVSQAATDLSEAELMNVAGGLKLLGGLSGTGCCGTETGTACSCTYIDRTSCCFDPP